MPRTTASMAAIAAAAAAMALLPAISPALATDAPATLGQKAAPLLTGSRVAQRHHVPFYHYRQSRPVQAELGCAGLWCGRQFVLMVGIGY